MAATPFEAAAETVGERAGDGTTASPKRVEALHAGPVGAAIAAVVTAGALVAAGAAAGSLSTAYGIAVVFLSLVVHQDTRYRKIPNWLIGAGLVSVLLYQAWSGGPGAAGMALLHSLTPFALLILPFALGVIGAGDVKAFMVLSALFGSATALALIVYSLVISGAVAFVWLWSKGELWLLFERAWLRLRAGLRTPDESQALPEGDAIGSALPLGAAIACSLAVRVLVERFMS